MKKEPKWKRVGKRLKEGLVTRKEKNTKIVREDEERAALAEEWEVDCHVQWRYKSWRTLEKMTECLPSGEAETHQEEQPQE